MRWMIPVVLAALLAPGPIVPGARAAATDYRSSEQARKVSALAADRTSDKLRKLAEGAKANKETEVTVYTSMNLGDSAPLIAAFGKWLSGELKLKAEVNLWRAASEKVLQRTLIEAQGGRFEVDVIETNGPELETLLREKITTPFWVPAFGDYPEAARHPEGLWHATRYNFFTAAYNTKLVKKEDVPKSYDDLLDPRWKGRIGIDVDDWDWFATLVKRGPWGDESRGLAYFKRLGEQQLLQRKGHTLIGELVGSGEIPFAVTTYNHSIDELKEKGAPIEWLPLEPVVARPNGVAIPANARNPHLALLFAQFLLSPEGQNVLLKQGRVPASPRVSTKLNQGFRYVNADPMAIVDEAKKWESLYRETLLRK